MGARGSTQMLQSVGWYWRLRPLRYKQSTVEIILARQDLLKCPLNPIDFFADYSDRLLVFRWVSQRSDSFQRASYLMIPRPNEREPRATFLAISVNSSDELSGEPGKYQTEQHLDRNAMSHA